MSGVVDEFPPPASRHPRLTTRGRRLRRGARRGACDATRISAWSSARPGIPPFAWSIRRARIRCASSPGRITRWRACASGLRRKDVARLSGRADGAGLRFAPVDRDGGSFSENIVLTPGFVANSIPTPGR
ncbi:hypothetical protein ACU4GD_22665 [Cupriavidus basilensis]